MPRRSLRFAAAFVVALGLLGAPPVAAEELPPGYLDGVVVGGDDAEPHADGDGGGNSLQPQAEGSVGTAAVTRRYFGRAPFDAVRAAATAAPRPCAMSTDLVTALVLSPVFKESSAATTPSTAPSPMTLARADEWSGTMADTTNVNANYGLYAFRNPNTSFKRAFWHPGVGIWQYDSAGLGAPFTTVEAMQVSTMATDVARAMTARYCNPSPTMVGHAAPFSQQERRYAAWGDWGYPCTLCEQFFMEMVGPDTSPRFSNLTMVDGITELGGTVQRTCALAGVSGTMPCWYVNPQVGTIQGASTWATLEPLDGGSPTVRPTPLSHPFYVIDRGATEERHWIRADTGYGIDIKASRQIGKNARPRSNQAGSGLTWDDTSGLCDLTADRGDCGSVTPAGVSSMAMEIGGSFRTTALDANGDDRGDILFYAPGTAGDWLWLATGVGTFTSVSLTVTRTYDTVRSVDVDGDGNDDLLWYDSVSGAAALWKFAANGTFTSIAIAPGARKIPLLMNLNQDAASTEIFWYGPGTTPDSVWSWNGSGFTTSARTINGVYTPITGDFDDNGRDDVLWYTPNGGADSIWYHAIAGGFTSTPFSIHQSYRTTVGDLDGDGHSDIVFHSPNSAADSIWFGKDVGTFDSQTMQVNLGYHPYTVDLFGTGSDAVIWYRAGSASDAAWTWTTERVLTSQSVVMDGSTPGLVGAFSTGGADGILFYGPGSEPDTLWYR